MKSGHAHNWKNTFQQEVVCQKIPLLFQYYRDWPAIIFGGSQLLFRSTSRPRLSWGIKQVLPEKDQDSSHPTLAVERHQTNAGGYVERQPLQLHRKRLHVHWRTHFSKTLLIMLRRTLHVYNNSLCPDLTMLIFSRVLAWIGRNHQQSWILAFLWTPLPLYLQLWVIATYYHTLTKYHLQK